MISKFRKNVTNVTYAFIVLPKIEFVLDLEIVVKILQTFHLRRWAHCPEISEGLREPNTFLSSNLINLVDIFITTVSTSNRFSVSETNYFLSTYIRF